jgi:hypothetical protein
MSHITTIKTEIRDLDALKCACTECGAVFVEGQTRYRWFGESVGDYPLPEGITKEQLGKCSHVIRVPGVEYEIGVVQKPNGHWTLAYDFWGPGQGLLQKFGEGCQHLMQLYAVHKTIHEAQKKGYTAQRQQLKDGSVKLVLLATGGAA